MSAPQLGPSPAQITMMSHNITARVAARKVRRRRHLRLAIATGVVAVGVAVTAAGIGVATAPPVAQAGLYSCFAADDPRGEFHGVSLLEDAGSPTGDALVDAVLESCDIVFGIHGVPTPDPTVCELPDLRLGVFPNALRVEHAAFCTSLGLGPPPTG